MWVGIGDRCWAPSRSYKAWEKGSLNQNFNSFSNMNRGRFLDCCLIGAHSSRRVGALEGTTGGGWRSGRASWTPSQAQA